MEEFIVKLNDFIWTYILIATLIFSGIWFTVKFGFVQIRRLPDMFRWVSEKRDKSKKGASPFQAFILASANRVGTGNIAGVATAIALGGPGAVFWMWLIAVIGSASSFVENTLAQVYKTKDKDGWRGGPSYYIQKGLGNKKLSIFFCLLTTFTFGLVFNSVQANTISATLESEFNMGLGLIAALLVIATALIIFGGVKSIIRSAEVMVPIMAIGYILMSFLIVLMNIEALPAVFSAIFSEGVMGMQQILAGTIGAGVLNGVRRGLFSNEAGMGSTPHAAATAETTHPAKQGLIQVLGVFVDTLIICTSTAMYVLISGEYATSGLQGSELAIASVGAVGAEWMVTFLIICILLFAFTSIIGNYYYGETNISYLTDSKAAMVAYRVAVLGMVLFGSLQSATLIWSLADITMALMALVNIYVIFRLQKVVRYVYADYTKQRKENKNPVFKLDESADFPGMENIEAWRN